MQCYGGPLDGHIANPSDIANGRAVFGLAREKSGFDFGKGDVPVFVAVPPTHKQSSHAEYIVRGGRLVYSGCRS